MSGRLRVITTHINADFDALASMLAAKKLYPDARVVFPGAQERSLRDFFVKSTFYLLEIDRIRDIRLDRVGTLILVDTRQRSRIGKFANIVDRPGLEIHIYDHHPSCEDDLRGDLEEVREVGATTTIMVEILRKQNIEITQDEATILALGIYEDTGSLTFSSTRQEDFLAMAYLRSRGARLSIISDLITRELTAEQIFILNDLIRSARKIWVNGVEVVVATASSDQYVGDFAVLVHKLRDMENIDVLFALARMEDRVFLVARSRLESVNVGQVALAFGGGGHATAASATIKDRTLIEAEEMLERVLEERVRPEKTAKEVMSFPVKTIQADQSIQEAGEILSRFNINVLPVMEAGRLVGLISRVVVQRAIYHGLQSLPVREYMTADFATARVDTPMEEVRRLIIDNAQRFLPVVEGERLVGAITRTDILRDLRFEGLVEKGEGIDGIERDGGARRKSILRVMEERIPEPIMDRLRDLGRAADDLSERVYVVGGFVRDLLLQQENLDVDLVVEGDGIDFARHYAATRGCRYRSHQRFGTAVIIFPDSFKVDVATARTEYYESPAALPTVELSSIKLDLYRRDFTVNTLAVCLNSSNFGELLDFFGGQRDLKDRTVRVLHNLSFVEDPTRVLRAVRFEQRFGFKIGKHTLNLIQNAVRLSFLERVDGWRLRHELEMILEEKRPLLAVQRLEELGVLRFVHPKLRFAEEKRKLFQEVEGALAWYELLYLDEAIDHRLVYLLALLDQLNDRALREALNRLSFSEERLRHWSEQKYHADRIIRRLKSSHDLRPSRVFKMLRSLDTETLLYMVAKAGERDVKRTLSQYISQWRRVRPILNGEDLKALGLKPGPVFRRVLDALRDAHLNGEVKSREDEVDFVRQRVSARSVQRRS